MKYIILQDLSLFSMKDCSTPAGRSSGICETLRCTVSGLEENDVLNFRVLFRLWSPSLNLAVS